MDDYKEILTIFMYFRDVYELAVKNIQQWNIKDKQACVWRMKKHVLYLLKRFITLNKNRFF